MFILCFLLYSSFYALAVCLFFLRHIMNPCIINSGYLLVYFIFVSICKHVFAIYKYELYKCIYSVYSYVCIDTHKHATCSRNQDLPSNYFLLFCLHFLLHFWRVNTAMTFVWIIHLFIKKFGFQCFQSNWNNVWYLFYSLLHSADWNLLSFNPIASLCLWY